jgi:hypothetical protein
MDITKVTAAITLARTELGNAIANERKVLADPKASVADASKAGPALMVAGIIDTALANIGADIPKTVEAGKAVGVLKSLTKVRKPKAKKAKKA